MNSKTSQSQSLENQSNLNAIHGLATIYLSGAERLTALNLTATRGLLEDTFAASTQRPSAGADSGFNLTQLAFSQPNVERTIAYSRSVYQIFLETQQEMIQTLSTQFSSTNASFKLPSDWSAPLEKFTKGVQEVSSQTAKNVSATIDATKSAIVETNSRLSKSA